MSSTFTEKQAEVALMKLKGELVDCSICGNPVRPEWTHNAYPVKEQRCCEDCNYNVVIPARLESYNKEITYDD